MKININKVISQIEAIYDCGAKDDGTHTRMAFSNEDIKARTLFIKWAEELGMTHRIDGAGNLIVHMNGKVMESYGITSAGMSAARKKKEEVHRRYRKRM